MGKLIHFFHISCYVLLDTYMSVNLCHLNLVDNSLHYIFLVCCKLFIVTFFCWLSCPILAFLFILCACYQESHFLLIV